MNALKEIINTDKNYIKISIPEDFHNKELEVIILPLNKEKKIYDFSKFVGKLKWNGDAVKEQRYLRNEW
jgi:hypothetical protein